MCILFIENEYVLTHDKADYISAQDTIGIYKRATFIYDEHAMQEMCMASVGANEILLLSAEFDKSECDAHHLKSKCHALRYAEAMYDSISNHSEYYFWFKSSASLAREMVRVILKTPLNDYNESESQQEQATKNNYIILILLQHLRQEHQNIIGEIDREQDHSHKIHVHGDCAFTAKHCDPLILHADAYKKDYMLCILYLLGGNEAHSQLCVARDNACGAVYEDNIHSFNIDYCDISKLYNVFNICRRVLNINWLQSAPYGPVSIEQFALQISPPIWPAFCTRFISRFVSYISPSAYLTAEHAPHGRVATVSVANMDSLLPEKQCMFYNYAIYFPEDLRAAIYLRFKDSQIMQMLSARLERIRSIKSYRNDTTIFNGERGSIAGLIVTNRKQVTFEDLRVRVFFDRGVFNARFHEDSADNDQYVCDALLELVDIYRNAHWLGVNIFHDDASAVFPRIIARFGCASTEYKRFFDGPLYISVLIQHIQTHIHGITCFNDDIGNIVPRMAQTYTLYTQQALQSKFFMARENLRLALSMTHRSVHEYINFIGRDDSVADDAKKYVCIAILHSGRYNCILCEQAYARMAQSAHVDLHMSHLQQDVNMLLKDMSQLSDCTLDMKEFETSLPNIDGRTTANEHICKELCAACANRDMIQLTAHEQRDIEAAICAIRMFNYKGSFNTSVDHLHADDIQAKRNIACSGVHSFTTTGVYTYTQ